MAGTHQIVSSHFNEKEYSHGGSLPGLRAGLMNFPEKDLTIVIFSNKWTCMELCQAWK